MASNESETFSEMVTANMPTTTTSETNQQLAIIPETEAETAGEIETSTRTTVTVTTTTPLTNPRAPAYRGVRFATTETEPDEEDDSWWWEVENENLTLDQVPNVTAVFTPSPEDIIEKPHCVEETQNVVLEENFDRLHRISERIKNTIHEQRERHLSESSDKSLSEAIKVETEMAKSEPIPLEAKEQSLEEFKEELRVKRLIRQTAVQDLREEISGLRKQLEMERDVSRRLRNGEKVEETPMELVVNRSAVIDEVDLQGACALSKPLDNNKITSISNDDEDDVNPQKRSRHANIELANAQLALQMANSDNISLRGELEVVKKQVFTLKEVIACCKQMLTVKEEQCNELKQRLTEIEKSFAEHEMKIMSDNLRQEYERQLVNIRQLRQLYEERQRVAAAEYENLQRLISIKRDELGQEQEKTKGLEERNENLVKENDLANNELACLRDECKEHRFEKAALKEEMGAVNTLFSQMVMGFNGKNNLDIDRLTTMLEENRTLLNDMATKECTDGATLPKLLFELVEQASVDSNSKDETPAACPDSPMLGNATKLDVEQDENNANNMQSPDDEEEQTECCSSTQEECDADDVGNGNVTVASVANDDDTMAATTSPTTATSPTLPTTSEQVDQANVAAVLVATDMAAVATASSSDASAGTNEKVIVTLQQTKSKKQQQQQNQQHHHSHHRKGSTNKKSTTSSSLTGTVEATTTMGTLNFNDPEVIGKVTSTQEIIGNLPKVWRVLMELLNHHHTDPVPFEENGKSEDCYKSVETPQGPKPELSVSKTYIKLKDLILEKKSLVKETNRLKTLNCHLDYRLNEQEKRLSAVSLELTKTWHLVGKMQRQHRQLHTQEQILRYQLQQKRRLLHELKDELEYCRRKWKAARAINDESQEQYNDLRREFARRKVEDANNSAESGYSDSGGPVSDEEAPAAAQVVAGVPQLTSMDKQSDDADGEEDDEEVCGAASMASTAAGGCVNYRRKRLREMFEHTRKIKRMQSISPGRAAAGSSGDDSDEVVLRWNSAPPTCGWRDITSGDDDEEDNSTNGTTGAIPKASVRTSRHPKRRSVEKSDAVDVVDPEEPIIEATEDRTFRIQRLEEQCKTLIKQVLETSDNRERLEVQLKRFQDEMSPVQYAVPLNELLGKKRVDRMTRASSVPIGGALTPREEEYTRRRSERLGRLEEESRQLLFRIKRTSDRGHYLRCSLDRIRRTPRSREGSLESNTEEEARKSEEETVAVTENNETNDTSSGSSKSPLTAEEEAYTARRAARLQRLEEESKQLLSSLSRNNQRSDNLGSRLDVLHERHGSQEASNAAPSTSAAAANNASTSRSSASPAGKLTTEQRIENIEKITSNREQRLRILEEEGRQLINRLSETSEKGTQMINRIAERELTRQNRSTSTPQRETDESASGAGSSIQDPLSVDSNSEETPVASALLPILKNVACTSIVSDELTERVTITTTPSKIAVQQGAIPKSKPTTQLLAARPKSARLTKSDTKVTQESSESLEDMVRRLQSLPFPKENDEAAANSTEDCQENPAELAIDPKQEPLTVNPPVNNVANDEATSSETTSADDVDASKKS